MNTAEAEEFQQFEVWCEIQGKDGYNSFWDTKVMNFELWL